MHPSGSQVGGGAIAAAPRRRLCVSGAASGPGNCGHVSCHKLDEIASWNCCMTGSNSNVTNSP
eukprot:1129138-Prymnesium_polylepis.1